MDPNQSTPSESPSPATTPASPPPSVAAAAVDVAKTAADAGALVRDLEASNFAAAIADGARLRQDVRAVVDDVRSAVKNVKWWAAGGTVVGMVAVKLLATAKVLAVLGGPVACTPAERQTVVADAKTVEADALKLDDVVCVVARDVQPAGDVATACNITETIVNAVRSKVAHAKLDAVALDAAAHE